MASVFFKYLEQYMRLTQQLIIAHHARACLMHQKINKR